MCLTKFAVKNIDFYLNFLKEVVHETYFQWLQLKHAIPHKWKSIIKQNPGNVSNLIILDHDLIE